MNGSRLCSGSSAPNAGHLLIAVLLFVGAPLSASAQSSHGKISDLSDAEKRRLLNLIKEGKAAYEQGKYEESLEAFQEAYRGLEHPDFAYRVALAHEKLGNYRKAKKFFERVIELDPDASDRAEIEERIERLEGKLVGTVVVTTEPTGAVVRLGTGGETLGRTRVEHEFEPGEYTLLVEKSNYESVQRTIQVRAGTDQALHFSLVPAPEPQSSTEGGGSGPYWVMGAGGVGVVGAGVSYALFQNHRQFVENADRSQRRPSGYDRRVDRAIFWNRAMIASGIVGLAGLAAGGTWALLQGGSESKPEAGSRTSRMQLVPALGPEAMRLQLRVDF